MYFGFYKEYRHSDNQEDVEDFLAIVPAKFAISWAFDYEKIGNKMFGAKYWNDLDAKWKLALDDKRKAFTVPGIDKAEREIKREERENKAVVNNTNPAPTKVVENDWSGMMDLVEVKTTITKKRAWQQPDENEIRLTTKKGSVVIINSEVSKICDDNGFDSMALNVDKNTNRMVLVFGNGFDYNVREYSADTKIVQHKSLGEYMKKYIDVEFDPNKAYFIKIAQRMFNKTHTQYAVVLSTRFTTKDNA